MIFLGTAGAAHTMPLSEVGPDKEEVSMAIGKLRLAGGVLVCLGLSACAAMGVVATSDPMKELGNAVALFDHGRPLPAERMIVDAIAQCEKTANAMCVGAAYRVYGLFFQSAAVTESVYFYEEHGFLDKSATWDTRFQASILYFRKAAAIAEETDHYDVVSNVHYHIGKDFAYMHDTASACAEFDQSLAAHEEFERRNPGGTVKLVEGHGSFGDTIAEVKRKTGCPGSG
jgi:hypothetical protein